VPVLAAGAFTIEYAIGGNNAVSTTTVMWSMLGTHALIGIGEAVITTLTVGAVLASRRDLVYGARGGGGDDESLTNRRPVKAFIATSAAVIVLLAAAVSPFASSSPDGLEKVAAETGIAAGAKQSATHSPLAGYGVAGIDDDKFATSVSGIIGTSVIVAFGLGTFAFTRRRRSRPA
jgi:cobalt/nickel transport system permease protein